MKKFKRLSILGIAVLAALPLFSAEQTEETQASVPALSAFHDVIYPIWHTAYPEKDYAALRMFAPQVKEKAQAIFEAELPGILRDKQEKWKAGLAEFQNAVDAYVSRASSGTDEEMWNAAEILHDRYERLVRIIRPPLKEVEDFHQVLYIVYHKHLLEKKFEGIKASVPDLLAKARAVSQATLPRRYESRIENFRAASSELLEACLKLEAACTSGNEADIPEAVEFLHAKYQALERVFE